MPAPDPVRLCVPKAFVELTAGATPDMQTALSILRHVRTRLSPYKRIRRLEFAPLPKTISGKIRRVELRQAEVSRPPDPPRNELEFWEEDFPEDYVHDQSRFPPFHSCHGAAFYGQRRV